MTVSSQNLPKLEKETRIKLIDPQIRHAGWEVDTESLTYDKGVRPQEGRRLAISEWPIDNVGNLDYPYRADYILFDGLTPVGIIEAKKPSVSPQNVLVQAKDYSKLYSSPTPLNLDGYKVPFLYACNGETIWFQDIQLSKGLSRQLMSFHTPDALQEKLTRNFNTESQWLAQNPNFHSFLYDYQLNAIDAVEKAIANHQRKVLLAMATGTGKTYTTISLCYRLIRSGVGKRILFLVDRRALAAQAASAFHAFDAEPNQKFDNTYEVYSQRLQQEELDEDDSQGFDPKVLPRNYLTTPQTKDAFVYICTIQRMAINLFGAQSGFELDADEDENLADVEKLDIPLHAFDVIIADECHRGYTASEEAKWRKVLDYFDAVKIGLTATPAAHTVGYFGKPVFTYSYDDAIREGRLVDYQEIHIQSDARINGVFLNEDERVSLIDPESGQQTLDCLEAEREYDASEIERKISSPDSNRKILEEFKKYADAHEAEYGRFPKTLIFAANDKDHVSHADQIVRMCREIFGRGEDFVQKITGNPNVYKPLRRLKEFRNLPEPGIVVTVDMLSTGVDVKPIECIIFLRPVKSRILWEQKLGRGTRLCKDLAPPKDHFKVFDCFGGTLFEYFRNASGMTAEAPHRSSRSLVQVIENIYQNRDRDYNVKCLVRRLQRIAKTLSGEGVEAFANYIPNGDLATFAQGLSQAIAQDFMGSMNLLRDPSFQELLLNPPKAKPTFMIALDHEDTVTSEAMIGKLKPEDYLQAFAHFVEQNQAQIEAIGILLSKPEHWNPQQLTALRKALKEAPEHFTENNLRKAYHQDLADIISMVKVAAKKEDHLLTGPERVARAMARIQADTVFTTEQIQWLNLIQMHLETNLSLDEQDFENLPVFLDKGGLGRARKIFGSMFQELIKRINKEVAA